MPLPLITPVIDVETVIAGVEVASGEFFNPVDPADVAARLRALL